MGLKREKEADLGSCGKLAKMCSGRLCRLGNRSACRVDHARQRPQKQGSWCCNSVRSWDWVLRRPLVQVLESKCQRIWISDIHGQEKCVQGPEKRTKTYFSSALCCVWAPIHMEAWSFGPLTHTPISCGNSFADTPGAVGSLQSKAKPLGFPFSRREMDTMPTEALRIANEIIENKYHVISHLGIPQSSWHPKSIPMVFSGSPLAFAVLEWVPLINSVLSFLNRETSFSRGRSCGVFPHHHALVRWGLGLGLEFQNS